MAQHVHSGAVHTFVSTEGVTAATAAYILPASSGKVVGTDGT
jgi:hypothetical protein